MSDKHPWGKNVDGLTPGSVKNISSLKLKAFNIGSMNVRKGLTKKEQEEMKKREEEDAAKVYEEFVESFEDTGKSINRAWIKGGVVNPDKEKAERGAYGGRMYKPMTKLAEQTLGKSNSSSGSSRSAIDKSKAKKGNEKKKSNLELFKEELQRIQEERQERRRVKAGGPPSAASVAAQEASRKSRFDPVPEPPALGTSLGIGLEDTLGGAKGSYTYSDDSMTTNLYLGNINPKMSEPSLCELFGKFGPLASVKIMWPRSEEERSRGRNCGFVAYMNRKDGERALATLQGKDIDGFEMKLGWGKAVPIPPHPVYVPPALAELTLPPPPSGLPFNCQPTGKNASRHRGPYPPPPGPERPDHEHREFNKILGNAVVKVVIPTERSLLQLIHRVIEFVVREGPMFEAMIMNREMSNPQYRFLFENQSPAHVYYRWKLFSILQGDNPYSWRTVPFNMFSDGSVWQPPPMDPYTQGMPDELLGGGSGDGRADGDPSRRGQLSESQRDRLEDMLRELTPEKAKVGDAMVWCLEHAESAEEVVECLSESLSLLETPLPKKIARLYLVSDILHNCSAKVPHASYYRKFFEVKLREIFKDMHGYYEKISGRVKAEQFKNRVMRCFRAWEDWAVYPNDLLIKLQNIFLGLVSTVAEVTEEEEEVAAAEVDGTPLDVDGMPLDVDGEPLVHAVAPGSDAVVSDLDGMPLPTTDVDGMPLKDDGADQDDATAPKFVRSKWETVDESELEAQAVTTSKWELLEQEGEAAASPEQEEETEQDVDGAPMSGDEEEDGESTESPSRGESNFDESSQDRQITEERRAKLREIELKVMKYQDELEAGKRTRKMDMSLQQQLHYYRSKLLNKEEEKEREKIRDREREKRRKDEEVRIKEWERAREKERDREREKQERERERLVKQIRDLSKTERGSERSSERSSERGSERNERRSRRERERSESPDPSPARGSLGMLMRGYGGRSSNSRSPSPASSSRSRGRHRSPSTPQYHTPRGSSNRRDESPKPKSQQKSRSPSSSRRAASKRSRSRSPRHKHKKHKSSHRH